MNLKIEYFDNKIRILLIDSQCYGCTIDYEKKLIIDENLDEFMI